MADPSVRIDLGNGSSALIELADDELETVAYGAGDKVIMSTVEKLKKAVKSGFTVARAVTDEFRAVFPDIDSAELTFGLSLEGTLDAKVVSADASCTFSVLVRVGKAS